MSKNNSKEVATSGPSGFAIIDDSQAREVMVEAFGNLGVTDSLLSRIKIPAGGMTAWQVEDIDGEQVLQNIDAIVVAMKGKQKAWWKSDMESGGGGTPPSCTSKDGINGVGVNTLDDDAEPGTHKCSECAWNQFGSSRSGGNAKECKDFGLLFFFREGSRIPSILQVPATSLKPLQTYVLRLIDAGKSISGVVTRLGLKKATSGGGITYSQLTLTYVSDLSPEARATMKEVSTSFISLIDTFDGMEQQ